ncbi:MAG TPA: hypothetical protein VD866_04575 [Urbifossiella sp.]|nr:hypothetical protein [Urbifossiella sp.]
MADIFWVGRQRRRAMTRTLTVTTADTGDTITVTTGGTKSVVVTPSTTNTTTTAAEIAAACEASEEPEFEEITWTSATNVVTAVGPEDGAPITISKTDGGTNATVLATTVAALSPNDLGDAANYAGAALPANLDRLVFQDGSVPVLYNLAAFTGVTYTVLRRDTYIGAIGLDDVNPNGYPEYRPTHLETAGATIEIEGTDRDAPGQFRFKSTAGGAVTVTIRGGVPAPIGEEVVEVYATGAASVYQIAGGALAIAPNVGQTATVGTLTATDASLRIGSGVTLGSVAGTLLQDVTALILSSWSNGLTLDGGEVTVGGAGTGALTIDGGRLVWRSTANPANSPTVASGGTLDLTQAPKVLTIGGTVSLYAGATLDDRNGRGGNYAAQCVRCTPQEVNWLLPNNKTLTLS